MQNRLKTLITAGVAALLPALVLAGDQATCSVSGATAACSAQKTDACCQTACPAAGAQTTQTAKPDKLLRADFRVSGMTCAACETKLTQALNALEGVSEPKACAQSKVAKVAFDPAKVKEEQILAAIRKAGFTVEAETIAVKVDGLKCGACSEQVGKKLAAVKGVKEQKVCHQAGEAVVTFDPAKVSRKDILAAIDASGFKAVQ